MDRQLINSLPGADATNEQQLQRLRELDEQSSRLGLELQMLIEKAGTTCRGQAMQLPIAVSMVGIDWLTTVSFCVSFRVVQRPNSLRFE
jgi:hypothetical protein